MSLPQLIELNARADAALREFGAMDLGYKYDDGLCEAYDPKKTRYPSLYINQVSDDVMGIPETGTATIKYKLTGRNMREAGGKKKYGMTVDVLSFEPEAEKKADAKKKAAGEAVKLGSGTEVVSLLELYADGSVRRRFGLNLRQFSDRTRNGDGQFVGGATGGADPVTMRQAYGDKPKNPMLAPGAAAAALAGAGLLGSKSGRVGVMNAAKKGGRVVRAGVAGLDRKLKGKREGMWPRMGSKAPKVRRSEGLGEVMVRTAAKAKTGAKWPRVGD